MSQSKAPQDKDVIALMDTLVPAPERDAKQAQQGRANFLAEIDEIDQAVSAGFFFRLNEWINTLPLPNLEKEQRRMLTAIVTGLTALVLFVSGVGATVLVSQDALPGDPLFSVKTTVEDARLIFGDDEADLALHQQLISLRNQEIEQLQNAGRTEDVEIAEMNIANHEMAMMAIRTMLGLEDPGAQNGNENSNANENGNENSNVNENGNENSNVNENGNENSNVNDNGNENSNDDDDDEDDNGNGNSNDDDDDEDDNGNSNSNDDDDDEDDNGNSNSNDDDDDEDDNGNSNSNDDDDDEDDNGNSNSNDDDDDEDDNGNGNSNDDDDDDEDDNGNSNSNDDDDDEDDDSSGSGSDDEDDDEDDD